MLDQDTHLFLSTLLVFAEYLFASSVAADDDQWLQFQVEEAVPVKHQLDQRNMWLMANIHSNMLGGLVSSLRKREKRCWGLRLPVTATRGRRPWRW